MECVMPMSNKPPNFRYLDPKNCLNCKFLDRWYECTKYDQDLDNEFSAEAAVCDAWEMGTR